MNRKIKIYVPKYFIPNKIKIKINGFMSNRNLLVTKDEYAFIKDLQKDVR